MLTDITNVCKIRENASKNAFYSYIKKNDILKYFKERCGFFSEAHGSK